MTSYHLHQSKIDDQIQVDREESAKLIAEIRFNNRWLVKQLQALHQTLQAEDMVGQIRFIRVK